MNQKAIGVGTEDEAATSIRASIPEGENSQDGSLNQAINDLKTDVKEYLNGSSHAAVSRSLSINSKNFAAKEETEELTLTIELKQYENGAAQGQKYCVVYLNGTQIPSKLGEKYLDTVVNYVNENLTDEQKKKLKGGWKSDLETKLNAKTAGSIDFVEGQDNSGDTPIGGGNTTIGSRSYTTGTAL